MAINMIKELQTISVRLKALSRKLDEIASGYGKSPTPKSKGAGTKSGGQNIKKTVAAIEISTPGEEPQNKLNINEVLEEDPATSIVGV